MVNRFYNAARGSYQSMFVPEELPTDLMLGALQQKQKQYDLADQTMQTELGDWNQRSLAGYDTKYTKGWKESHEKFINENKDKDFTSPDFQRNYRDYMKKFKSDEGLNQVRGAVDTHDAFLLRYNALRQDKDTYAAAEELANEYNTRFGKYTDEQGLGYTGDIKLGNPNTLTGNDIDALGKKLYDDIKESGSDNVKQFENFSYKTNSSGVSQPTLDAQTLKMIDHFIDGPGGNQLIERYNKEIFGKEVPSIELQKMSKDEKDKYTTNARNYVLDYLRDVSSEFKNNKFTTNLDDAKNSQHEENKTIVQQENLEIDGSPVDRGDGTFDEAFGANDGEGTINGKPSLFTQYGNGIQAAETKINLYKGVIDAVNSGKPINFTPEQKLMLQGLPGGDQVLAGGAITGDIKTQLVKALDKSQTAEVYKLNTNKTRYRELEDKYAEAVAISTNNKTFRNENTVPGENASLTFREAVAIERDIQNDPTMNKVVSLYNGLKQKDNNLATKVLRSTIDQLQKNIKEGKGGATAKVMMGKLVKYNNAIQAQNAWFKEAKNEDPDGEKVKFFKSNYNNLDKEYSPKAQVAQKNDYRQYDPETGKMGGIAKSVDVAMEKAMQNDLSQFTVIDSDTGEEIPPTIPVDGKQVPNPKYPNPKTLVLGSTDKEILRDMKDGILVGSKVSMNVTGMENTYEGINIPGVKTPKVITGQQQRRYKVIASGMTTKSYTDAKYRQNMSNYYANPESETGKQSYIDAIMFKDPEYGAELAKVKAISGNQTGIMKVKMFSPGLAKEMPYTIEVTGSDLKDGQLIAVVRDYQDNAVTKPLKFANIKDFDKHVRNMQNQSKANVENAQKMGYTGNAAEINTHSKDEEEVVKTAYDKADEALTESIEKGKVVPVRTVYGDKQIKIEYKKREDVKKKVEKSPAPFKPILPVIDPDAKRYQRKK